MIFLSSLEANCRDRWKNIRCAFVRSQKYAGKFKKQYYLADHLAFLLPYTKRKVGSAKVSTEFSTVEHHEYCLTNDGDVNKSEDRKVTLELTLSDDNEHNSDSLTATPIEKDVITKKRKVISQLENEADGGSFVKWVNATQNNQNKTKEEDADLLFLRSLLPEVKRLSDKKKRTFKRKVLTLLDELLDDA